MARLDREECDNVDEGRGQTALAVNNAGEREDERSADCQVYQIRVKGHLDSRWSRWLGDLVMIHENDGTTVLTGPITDQPALHGLLIKVRNLGLTLLSVKVLEPDRWGSAGPQGSSGDESASGKREEPR